MRRLLTSTLALLMLVVGLVVVLPAGPSCGLTDPCDLRVTASSATTVDLAWNVPADLTRFNHYDVMRKDPGSATYRWLMNVTPSSNTTFHDAGLTPLAVYTYRILHADASHAVVGSSEELIVIAGAAAPSPILRPGLVAAYSFDEGGGVLVLDASGKGNHGTVTGTSWSGAGRFGGALSFDGVGSLVTVPDAAVLDLTTGMTLAAWVQPRAAMGTSWRTALVKEATGDLSYALYANSGNGRPSVQISAGGAVDARGASQVAAGGWVHLAGTFDGATLRLFVGGSEVSSRSVSKAIATSGGPLRIGGNAVWGEWFDGLIDEVRVYDRALSPSELVEDMSLPVGGASSPSPSPSPVASPSPSPSPSASPGASPSPSPSPSPSALPSPSPPATSTADRVFTGSVSLPEGFAVPAGQRWRFDPGSSTTVEVSRNVVVEGILEMRPSSADVVHTLRFTGVNEANYAGGGDDVVASDVGLWVMGAGQLDVVGSPKLAWTHANAVQKGASSITVQDPPAGWRVGDDVVLTPTVSPTYPNHDRAYDSAQITSIGGSTIGLSAATGHPHPSVQLTAARAAHPEVLNLTRNARIEGTPAGRAHIFIRSSKPQTLKYAQIRHMGPRKPNPSYPGSRYTLKVLGRYGIHFHHSFDGSRGSIVEGVVMRDNGNHSFVPHLSHGITFRMNVAHNVMETAYWWDGAPNTTTPGDPTHAVTFERNIASLVFSDDVSKDNVQVSGFWIGRGGPPMTGPEDQNRATGNVAVGVAGVSRASGFIWPEGSEGIWLFEDNTAHNNKVHGIFVWQITRHVHPITRFVGYYNGELGIFHGAYDNNYHYRDGILHGNEDGQMLAWGPSFVETGGFSALQRWDNMVFDGAGISDFAVILAGRAIPPEAFQFAIPTVIAGSSLKGYKHSAVKVTFDFHDFGRNPVFWELVANDYGAGNHFWFTDDIHEQTRVHVVDPVHGDITLRRGDQPGTYVPEWNARRS